MKRLLLLSLLLVIPLALGDILITPEQAGPGEVVRITIEPVREAQTLIIVSPTNTYRFVGGLEHTTSFIPDVPGKYSVRLVEENDIVGVASFSVYGDIQEKIFSDALVIHASQPQVGEPITIDAPLMNVDYIAATLGGNKWISREGIRPLTYTPTQGGNLTVTVYFVNSSTMSETIAVLDTTPLIEQEEEKEEGPFLVAKRDGNIIVQTIGNGSKIPPGKYDIDVGDANVVVKFKGMQHTGKNIRFEKVPLHRTGLLKSVDAFAVDPTTLDFEQAEITFTAVGNELYKCIEYNYTTQECTGEHRKILDLIPGQTYTIPLTKQDPLFTQTGYLTNADFAANTNGWTTLTESGNVNYAWQSSDTPQSGVAEISLSGSNKQGVGNYYQPFNLTIPAGTSIVQINFSAKWRISTFSDPGSIELWVQDVTRSTTYCSVSVPFSGTTTWRQENLTTAVTPGCNLASFSENTNYTFRIRCSLDTGKGGGQSEVCHWDDTSVVVTYNDTTAPVIQDIVDSPDPVDKGGIINFTVNITDNVGVNTTTIEIDGVNYSLIKNGGDIYYYDAYDTDKTPGLYYYHLFANDSNGNEASDVSTSLNFTIRDTTEPYIELISPETNTYTPNTSFVVFFNLTDNVGVDTCELIVNSSVVNTTTITPLSTTLNLTGVLSDEGFHQWNITCNDTSNNINTSLIRNITRDTIDPMILLDIQEGTQSNVANTVFSHTPTDTWLDTCYLYTNTTGSWSINQTNTTHTSGISNNFVSVTLEQGTHLWNVICTDLAGNTGTNLTNFTYSVDYQPPNWSSQATYPSSGVQYVQGASYQFNITVTDNIVGLHSVVLETDRTGSLQNETSTQEGDVFYVTLTDLAAGDYTYQWYMNDSLGNTNSTTLAVYTVAKATSDVIVVINETFANWTAGLNDWINITGTVNVPSGGFIELYVDQVLTNTNFSKVYNLTQLAEEKRYNITAVYPTTQNYSRAESTLFADVVDTTPPSVSLDGPENESIIQPDVTFTFLPDDNVAIANCTLVLNGTLNTTKDVEKGVLADITVNNIPDGYYNWTVNCSDTTNNTYVNETVWYFTVDGVDPAAFSLLLPVSGNISMNRSPVFTWEQSSDMHFDRYTIQVDNDINFGSINHHFNLSGVTNTNKQFTLNDETLWYWRIFAYDQAGNVRESTETFNYTTDTIPPGVSQNTPTNNSYLNTTTVNLSYSISDFSAFANCSLFVNGTVNQTENDVTSGDRWFVVDTAEEVYTWNVQCYDVAGNSNATVNRTFTSDITLPASFLTTGPANNSVTNDNTPEYSWLQSMDTNFDRYVVQVSDNESFPYFNFTFTNLGVTNTSVNQSPAMSDNTWYWRVLAYDLANNYYISHPSFDTDTTPPTEFDLLDPVNDTQQRNDTPLFMWEQANDPHFLNYTLVVSQSSDFSTIIGSNGTYSKTETEAWLSIPQNNILYWMVTAWDEANNSRNSTNIFTYIADFVAPVVQQESPDNEQEITTNNLVFFEFNVSDIGTIENCTLYINNSVEKTLNDPVKNTTQTITQTLENGHYSWYVNCTDKAENTGRSGDRNVTVNTTIPTQKLYEQSDGISNYTSSAFINLGEQDSFENFVSFSVPGTSVTTAANATLIIDGEGMLIFNDTLVNFSGEFEQSHNNVFYITWKLNKQNTSGDTLLCQDGNDGAGGTPIGDKNRKILTGNCIITIGDVRLYANDNLTLTVNAYSGAGTARSFTHYWDAPVESWVMFDGYDLGRLVVNFTNLTDPAINETSAYKEICNVTCVEGSCLSTQVFMEIWDGTNWINISHSQNLTLNGSQANPEAIGNLNTTELSNFTLYGNLYSFNNSIRCTATSTYSTESSPEKNVSVIDRQLPNVTIDFPPNTTAYDPQNISFGYTATDIRLTNCSLWGNWSDTWKINQTVYNMTSEIQNWFDPVFLSYGVYGWNVQCYDNASNSAYAENNYTLFIAGNIEITDDHIYFSDDTPIESVEITITANVTNLANKLEPNVTVAFYDGVPGAGGTQINGNKSVVIQPLSWNTTSIQWVAEVGTNYIYVVIDPPNGSGDIVESDETNNIANRTITTSMWQIYYGNVTGNLTLGLSSNETFIEWTLANELGNIYVSDTDTTNGIGWLFLEAFGRTTSGINTSDTNNDFDEFDSLINTAQYLDSVNKTYRNESGSIQLESYFMYGSTLDNISIANTSANFSTGILWDSDDSGNSYYDNTDKEDILFVTKIKDAVYSPQGLIEYELWVPSNFTEYKGGTSEVTFYYEIQ